MSRGGGACVRRRAFHTTQVHAAAMCWIAIAAVAALLERCRAVWMGSYECSHMLEPCLSCPRASDEPASPLIELNDTQLFVDDFFVHEAVNVHRVLGQVPPLPEQPVVLLHCTEPLISAGCSRACPSCHARTHSPNPRRSDCCCTGHDRPAHSHTRRIAVRCACAAALPPHAGQRLYYSVAPAVRSVRGGVIWPA